LLDQNDFIAAMKIIFAYTGLLAENGARKMYSSYSMESRKNSQTIDQEAFLNEAVKTTVLFHYETALSRICNVSFCD
jgi:hypothetical protein